MTRLVLALAGLLVLAGLVLVAVGVGLWLVPAGLAVGGVEAVVAGYVVAYLEVKR